MATPAAVDAATPPAVGQATYRLAFLRGKMRPAFSGNNEYWERLYPMLRERGVAIAGVIGLGLPGLPEEEVRDGIRYLRCRPRDLPYRRRELLCLADASRHLVKLRGEFDILYNFGADSECRLFANLTARLLGKRIIMESTLAGSDDPEAISRRALGRLRLAVLGLAHGHVTLSPVLTAAYRRGAPRLPVREIRRGCDNDVFRPRPPGERAALRRELGLPLAAPVALFVGSIQRRKGVDILIAAWRAAVERLPPGATLVLVGPLEVTDASVDDGPERARFLAAIQEEVRTSGLGASVRFAGRSERVADWLGASDVFVFPSRAEGMPNALVEAMSSGLPCVSAALDGTAAAILGDAGVIVGSEDPAEYADAIVGLLDDPARRALLAGRARATAIARYSMRARVEEYLDLFAAVMRG